MYMFSACCGCSVGRGRSSNEDNFYFDKKHLAQNNKGLSSVLCVNGTTQNAEVLAVFDGMGGERNGDEASYIAAVTFGEKAKELEEVIIPGKAFMTNACILANERICDVMRSKQIKKMGTTVASLLLFQNEVVGCNVGDSRIFRIRDDSMMQISKDHTDKMIMSTVGINKKPVLLQYLGIPDTEMMLDPYISRGELKEDDIYVVCSDGVTDFVSMEELYRIVREESIEKATETICSLAGSSICSDNSTVIIVKIGKQE